MTTADSRDYHQENLQLSEVSELVQVRPGTEVPREGGRLVVAHGSATKSLHTIAGPGATLFGPIGDPIAPPILVVEALVHLVHAIEGEGEVGSLEVEPGRYAVILLESDARYAGPSFLCPTRHDSPLYIERDAVCIVGAPPDVLTNSARVDEPTNFVSVLDLSVGERAWLEGRGLTVFENAQRDRFYAAKDGGAFVHERNGRRTTLRLPRFPFRIVWG